MNKTNKTMVESTDGPFWVCLTIVFDEDGTKYTNLVLRYKGEAILALSEEDEINGYLMTNVGLNIEIMKAEVSSDT